MITPNALCLCGSQKKFSICCQPVIDGISSALTAESLMRSRYCAFITRNDNYLLDSWHPSTRPKTVDAENSPVWRNLKIIKCTKGRKKDMSGTVEFIATAMVDSRVVTLHETSRFIKENGRWYYVDGRQHQTGQGDSNRKTGRNSPCPCGSGKKFKKCCNQNC